MIDANKQTKVGRWVLTYTCAQVLLVRYLCPDALLGQRMGYLLGLTPRNDAAQSKLNPLNLQVGKYPTQGLNVLVPALC